MASMDLDAAACLLTYLDQLCLAEFGCLPFDLPASLRPTLMQAATRDVTQLLFQG